MKRIVCSTQPTFPNIEHSGVSYSLTLNREGYLLVADVANQDGKVGVYTYNGYIYVDYGDEYIAKFTGIGTALAFASLLVKETSAHTDDLEYWLREAASESGAVDTYWG